MFFTQMTLTFISIMKVKRKKDCKTWHSFARRQAFDVAEIVDYYFEEIN